MSESKMATLSEPQKFTSSESVPVSNPDNLRAVYANNIGASTTGADFRLFFSELGVVPDGLAPKQTQEVKAIVTMPIASAQSVITVLQQILAGHQELMNAAEANKVVKQ